MNYDDFYLLSLIKKLAERLSLLESRLGVVINQASGGGLILRESRTLPTEPPPPDVTTVWFLSFVDGSPGLIWNPGSSTWI